MTNYRLYNSDDEDSFGELFKGIEDYLLKDNLVQSITTQIIEHARIPTEALIQAGKSISDFRDIPEETQRPTLEAIISYWPIQRVELVDRIHNQEEKWRNNDVKRKFYDNIPTPSGSGHDGSFNENRKKLLFLYVRRIASESEMQV